MKDGDARCGASKVFGLAMVFRGLLKGFSRRVSVKYLTLLAWRLARPILHPWSTFSRSCRIPKCPELMSKRLEQFAHDLHQEVLNKTGDDANPQLREDAFTEY